MCLHIKRFTSLRKARRDITVFKKLSGYPSLQSLIVPSDHTAYFTPFQRMEVYIGETYHSELRISSNPFEGRGRHVDKGLHAWRTEAKCRGANAGILAVNVKCIIPKGSQYYIGRSKDIVSDTLKYIQILT